MTAIDRDIELIAVSLGSVRDAGLECSDLAIVRPRVGGQGLTGHQGDRHQAERQHRDAPGASDEQIRKGEREGQREDQQEQPRGLVWQRKVEQEDEDGDQAR